MQSYRLEHCKTLELNQLHIAQPGSLASPSETADSESLMSSDEYAMAENGSSCGSEGRSATTSPGQSSTSRGRLQRGPWKCAHVGPELSAEIRGELLDGVVCSPLVLGVATSPERSLQGAATAWPLKVHSVGPELSAKIHDELLVSAICVAPSIALDRVIPAGAGCCGSPGTACGPRLGSLLKAVRVAECYLERQVTSLFCSVALLCQLPGLEAFCTQLRYLSCRRPCQASVGDFLV